MIEFEHLIKLTELLSIEKEEDLKIYKEQFLRCNIFDRVKNGLSWYPITINNIGYGFGENIVIELERTNNLDVLHQFQFGKNAELFCNEDKSLSISGIIKNLEGNKIAIAFNLDDAPDWINDGKLGLNILFDEMSYREMEFALNKVIKAENTRLGQLRGILLGNLTPSFNTNIREVVIEELNETQNKAVNKILSARDYAIIHGPPGTGKTTTLVAAIKETLIDENQILVCSPSNIAIDVICEKLIEKGINVTRLGNPVRVSETLLKNTLDGKMTSHAYYKEFKDFKKRAEEYRNMAQKYKRNYGHSEREQRNLLFFEARNLLKEASRLENFMLNDSIEKAQVVACTLVGASHRLLRDKRFSTVFIDEAAQALEPAMWIPILKADRVIFAGDHFQLPPTVKSFNAGKEGLKITLFEKCIQKKNVGVMLETQYRMHTDIMNYSNYKFYNGKLKADSKVAHWHLGLKEKTEFNLPVEFIDTSGCGFDEEQNSQSSSLSNPGEASILTRHLKSLLDNYLYEKPNSKLSIGIISPYKAQVELIESEIVGSSNDLLKYKNMLSIKSIDGFQGQEKDVIYISLVRSNNNGEIGFLSDTRRMNVALTRARKKLVVIGDSATLANHPFYKDFLDYIDTINSYKSAWDYFI